MRNLRPFILMMNPFPTRLPQIVPIPRLTCCFLLWLISLHTSTTSAAEIDLLGLEDVAVRQAVSQVASCVVRIETLGGTERVQNQFLGGGPTTGLIIAPDGWVLSSAFGFLNRPASILVQLPGGERRPARIVARDRSRHLVLLRVEGAQGLPVPTFVSRDRLQVGQRCIAVGRTFVPEEPNVSVGIVSAVRRINGRAVQTDAKVSPSNYGGPLVTLDGEVIGLLAPLSPDQTDMSPGLAGTEWYDSGVGFAVPLEQLFRRLSDLQNGIDLMPGRLGVILVPGFRFTTPPTIQRIIPGTPAAGSGLQQGDLITHVDGRAVDTLARFHTAIGQRYAGDTVPLTLRRSDATHQVDVPLMAQVPQLGRAFLGILPQQSDTADLPAEAPREEKDGSPPKGVLVHHVFANTPANRMGLQPMDRITHFDNRPIAHVAALAAALEGCFPGESRNLRYERNGQVLEGTFESIELQGFLDPHVPRRNASPSGGQAPVDRPGGGEKVDADSQRGVMKIAAQDAAPAALAYLPSQWSPTTALSLLVILATPGTGPLEEVLAPWQQQAESYGLALLAVQPSRTDRWMPIDTERILQAMQTLAQRQKIHASRVAIFGSEGGGSMAMLVAFRNLRFIRGVLTLDAPPPASVEVPSNQPGERLSFWIAKRVGSVMNARIDETLTILRERRFPTLQVDADASTLSDPQRQSAAQWIDQLDML